MADEGSLEPQTPLQLPEPVSCALTLFAETTRRLLILRAVAWIAATLIASFTLIGLLDKGLMLEDTPRRLLAYIGYATALFLAWKLFRFALKEQDPADVALALEERVPDNLLEERLSTTVEIAKRQALLGDNEEDPNATASEGLSLSMVEWVANETAEILEEIDVAQLPDQSRTLRAAKFGGAALALAIILCIIPHLNMPMFYARAFLPWLNLHRPSNTIVEVLTGNQRLVDGETLNVEARITGAPATEVHVETREPGARWQQLAMDRDAAKADRFNLKLGPLHEGLQYRVCANDAQSISYDVTLLPRPEVAALKIVVHPPHYSKLPDETLERLSGDLSLLKGSKVDISVNSNTPLNAAVLEFGNDRKLSMTVDNQSATASFDIKQDTTYRIQLRSSEGVTNPDAPLYNIRALADLPPQVTVISPHADETVDSSAVLQLEVRAEDDLAVTSMRLVAISNQRAKPIVMPLEKPPGAGKVWMVSQPWDLAGLFLDGNETVAYHVEALDGLGSIGRSDERSLRIESSHKTQDRLTLLQLDEAQGHLGTARKLLEGMAKDVQDMRRDFRAEDVDFQAAERLLLAEGLSRIAREVHMAAGNVEAAVPNAEEGPLKTLLTALGNGLTRFSENSLIPLQRGAVRARSNDAVSVTAGLDVLNTLLPGVENELKDYHLGTTAGHRYAGASRLVSHAEDIRGDQARIAPILVGSAGWTAAGPTVPGLLAEYYRGTNFQTLARRVVESRLEFKNQDMPDVGRENFSVRWRGQVLAPTAGHYVFRAVADDGVHLDVDGKRLIDQWKSQSAAAFEGPVDLTAGWHDIEIEYYQGGGDFEINIQRSGPKIAMNPIPASQLRSVGTAVSAVTDARVREAMAKAASEGAVKEAMVRLQTMIEAARELPVELGRLAKLQPTADNEGVQQSSVWNKEVTSQTALLKDMKSLSSQVTLPLLEWRDHAAAWAERYKAVRERYRLAMLEWSRKLANNAFTVTAKLHKIQENAENAAKAFQELAQASHQSPKDATREANMAKADATVRALAEDLRAQATEVKAELKEDAADVRRSVEERKALDALEAKAEAMARTTAAELDRKLKESATPEELAKSEQNVPNFGTRAEEMKQQAAELAQQAERVERAMALRDALQSEAKELAEAREALTKAPSAANAAQEQKEARELKDEARNLKEAAEQAKNAVNPALVQKAEQLAQNAAANKAETALNKEAAESLAGKKQPAAEAQANAQTAQELGQQAKAANDTADAVNHELAALAQQIDGDMANALRDAANKAQEAGKAEAGLPKDKPAPLAALQNAATNAEKAREEAEHTADRLALDAQAAHEGAKNDEQRAQADDLARLAAAVRNDATQKLEPNANALDRALNNPGETPDIPKDAVADAPALAKDLNKLADIAQKLNSGDANQRKQAHEELNKNLEEKGIAANVDAALAQANALDKIAQPLNEADKAQGKTPADKAQANANDPAAANAAQLDAAREALQQAEGDPADKTALNEALGDRVGELAQELRKEAEAERQTASHLEQAAGLEQQARERLKQDGKQIANELKDAGKKAGDLAKSTGSQPLALPLNNAKDALPKAGDAIDTTAQKADTAPLAQLADQLNKLASDLEKPSGDIAAALGNGNDNQNQQAQQIGQETRGAAGQEMELAKAFERAERAREQAQGESQAANGDRDSLEAQVKDALDALQKDGALPAAAGEDIAALKSESAQAGQNAQGKQGQQGQQGQSQKGQGKSSPGQKGQDGQSNQSGQGNQDGQSSPAALEAAAEQARENAEQLAKMAAQMDRVAQAMQAESSQGRTGKSKSGNRPSQSPLADAAKALAKAEADAQTGDSADAKAAESQAAALLAQAAEAARSEATGEQVAGSNEAQSMAEGKSEDGQGKGQGKSQSGKGGNQGAKSASQGKGKGSNLIALPPGLPIDKATWNRLPDSLRRDLLNASGSHFPAEYETSIRNYFRNLAASKQGN